MITTTAIRIVRCLEYPLAQNVETPGTIQTTGNDSVTVRDVSHMLDTPVKATYKARNCHEMH